MPEPFRLIFNKTQFYLGAPTLEHLPTDQIPEIAVAGRSNAGKSTLINNLTHQNKLARTSQTPGKTKEINLFNLFSNTYPHPCARLVDLPGYGYAKVSKSLKESWQHELTHYLATRENLQVLIVIIDSRMPPTELDKALIEMAAMRNLAQIFVFNKIDKLNQSALAHCKKAAQALNYHTPNSQSIFYASPKNIGRDQLQQTLSDLVETHLQQEEN